MKKILITFTLLMAFPLVSLSQNKAIEALADKYSDREGFTTSIIRGEILKMQQGSMRINEINISDIMRDISAIIMISSDKPDKEFSDDIKKAVSGGGYKTIISVTEDGQLTRFLLATVTDDGKKKNTPGNELVMMLLGPEDNMLISISGNYKIKQITKKEETKTENM